MIKATQIRSAKVGIFSHDKNFYQWISSMLQIETSKKKVECINLEKIDVDYISKFDSITVFFIEINEKNSSLDDLKKIMNFSDTPVVVITNLKNEHIGVRSIELGAEEY